MRTKKAILKEANSFADEERAAVDYYNAVYAASQTQVLTLEVLLDIREQNEKIIQLLSSKSPSN